MRIPLPSPPRRGRLAELSSRATGLLLLLGLVGLAGCDLLDSIDGGPDGLGSAAPAVFLMTNASDGNAVIAYAPDGEGGLAELGRYPTGGDGANLSGNPDALNSQNALELSDDGRILLAANAGSGTISAFRVGADGALTLASIVAAGEVPVSIDEQAGRVYVADRGGNGAVLGFALADDGTLSPLPGAGASLGDAPSGPGIVLISPDGRHVVVTERATDEISVFPVGSGGALGEPSTYASPTPTPFGAAFVGDVLVVSNANAPGGPPAVAGGSTVSSYRIGADGTLAPITDVLATTQTAACWVETTPGGTYAYTSNTPVASVSSVEVGPDGALTLAEAVAAPLEEGAFILDAAASGDVLYAILGTTGEVRALRLDGEGALTDLGAAATFPPSGAFGIAAR